MGLLAVHVLDVPLHVFLSREWRRGRLCAHFCDYCCGGWSSGGDTGAAETRYEFADRCAEWPGNARLHLELELLQHGLDGT